MVKIIIYKGNLPVAYFTTNVVPAIGTTIGYLISETQKMSPQYKVLGVHTNYFASLENVPIEQRPHLDINPGVLSIVNVYI